MANQQDFPTRPRAAADNPPPPTNVIRLDAARAGAPRRASQRPADLAGEARAPGRARAARPVTQRPGAYGAPQRTAGGKRPPRGKRPFPFWTLPVILTCLALLVLGGWWVQQEYDVYQRYLQVRDQVNRATFYANTTVDGIDLGGKTYAQAQALLEEQDQRQSDAFALTIVAGEKQWRITSQEVPVGADSQAMLRRAWAAGRSGSLQKRYSDLLSIEQHGIQLTSAWGYDRARVRVLTDQVATAIDQPAVDAKLRAFDPNTKTFVFEPERDGYLADAERLYNEVTAALDARQYDVAVQVRIGAQPPRVRQADLAPLYGRISVFSTTTTTDKNRNTNIALSAQAINGKMVLPGESLSFNESTGQRTTAKGYREAGAIQGGQLVDETGGGVCQTSSTLFNAVVRADLEILTRSEHAWPSSYVPRGEDAAVDYPRLDFKFRNNLDAPIFIMAWFENQEVTVEVYGKLPTPGRTIELYSETLKTYTPSNEVIYTRKTDLPSGTNKVAKQKRTGYRVDTYKVYYQDGAEAERALLWRTEYKPVQKEVYFN